MSSGHQTQLKSMKKLIEKFTENSASKVKPISCIMLEGDGQAAGPQAQFQELKAFIKEAMQDLGK